MKVVIDGSSLTIDKIIKVAREFAEVEIAGEALESIKVSRGVIEKILADKKIVYGVNTGFGQLSNVSISEDELDQLQYNLVVSCVAGVGRPLPVEVVRAMLLLRANSLAGGYSGVRPVIVETMVAMLNKKVHPVVPEKGSVGASGDLAPLSHMALVLMGRGEAYFAGELLPGYEAMQKAGIPTVTLKAKEGLSLCNGTQAMTALGALAVYDAEKLAYYADVIGSLSAEALEAVPLAFDRKIHDIRPHPGQVETAENIRYLLEGSEILANPSKKRVQDAYSLRCMPQVHGASKDAIGYVKKVIETEINSVTDNPLVFSETEEVLSGGNFHGQPIALVMDFLAIALSELGNISQLRTERLTNPALSMGLPAFLIEKGGLNDGFMVAQYTAASLVSENKVLAHPASVDSIPTSADQEDHVSMGTTAARKCREVLENVQYVLAIEAICACQGIDFRKYKPSPALQGVYQKIRNKVSFMDEDREMSKDFEEVVSLIRSGELLPDQA
ncbi:MAG: histidine ammonia-lyase [Bacillota bacterium]|nr:histidine ammonia-lyase [Bacillota bacterium]